MAASKDYRKRAKVKEVLSKKDAEQNIRLKTSQIRKQRVTANVYSIISAMEQAIQNHAYHYVNNGEVEEDFDASAIDILFEEGIVKFDLQKYVTEQYRLMRN